MINTYSAEIVDAIMETIKEPETVKEGYHYEPAVVLYAENGYLRYKAQWLEVPNNGTMEISGTELDPIPYEKGMEVEAGKWYTEHNRIRECIKSGTSKNFNDKKVFNVKS